MDKKILKIANRDLIGQVMSLLEEGKRVTIPVKGKSMQPFIREGDRVMLKPFRRKDLWHGTVVLAKVADSVVLHRVVRFNRKDLWLAGDANLSQHERVRYLDVLATAIRRNRGDQSTGLNWPCKRCLGMLWYYLRPARRIMKKIFYAS